MKMLLVLALLSPSAFAYSDGTYHCKNAYDSYNDYKFETISLGSLRVPLVEATLRYREKFDDPHSPMMETITSGTAIISVTGDTELLSLNNLHFEFVKGELSHCKK